MPHIPIPTHEPAGPPPAGGAGSALPAACLLPGSLVLLRLLPPRAYALLPPCPIHHYLHLLCPGCGGTRALLALLHGHLLEAWRLNPLLLLLSPLLAVYAAAVLSRIRHRRGNLFPPLPSPVLASLLTAIALFTLARNLPW